MIIRSLISILFSSFFKQESANHPKSKIFSEINLEQQVLILKYLKFAHLKIDDFNLLVIEIVKQFQTVTIQNKKFNFES